MMETKAVKVSGFRHPFHTSPVQLTTSKPQTVGEQWYYYTYITLIPRPSARLGLVAKTLYTHVLL